MMTDEQTLVMYSGHPMGLFPSHKDAPRVVVSNGMVIPNYSKPDDWEKFNALGVSQFGQMTAGSYMYIGPQGIVHGTTITLLNAEEKYLKMEGLKGKIFVTSGLGGMSGAQPKAGNIAGCISITAEVNQKVIKTRHDQGWVDEVISDLDILRNRVLDAKKHNEIVSIAYQGNVVDIWEKFHAENIYIDLGSDQTSLHNPWAGGYYPVGMSFEQANKMMVDHPDKFKKAFKSHFEDILKLLISIQLKELISLTMEMLFYLKYLVLMEMLCQKTITTSVTHRMYKILWDQCVLTMDLVHFDGYVLQKNQVI